MGYLGSKPQNGFISNAKERYTGITTAYVDLNHSISSLADVIVWVNFVKQDATNLTLTSSTRITLGGTLVSADIVEVAYLGKAVATQNPSTNSVTNDMLAGSIANSKLANSSITLNGSAVSLGGSATVGGTNDVMFSAYMNSNVAIQHEVITKLEFDAEIYDVGSCFDTSNYRFTVPSGKQGYYHIGYSVNYESTANTTVLIGWTKPYKNGSAISYGENSTDFYQNNTNNPTRNVHTARSFIVNLSASDYIELYGQIGHSSGGSATVNGNLYYSNFWGYKLIT